MFVLQVRELVKYLCEQMKYEHPVSMNVISLPGVHEINGFAQSLCLVGGAVAGSGH